jgi:hypothetical protein
MRSAAQLLLDVDFLQELIDEAMQRPQRVG